MPPRLINGSSLFSVSMLAPGLLAWHGEPGDRARALVQKKFEQVVFLLRDRALAAG